MLKKFIPCAEDAHNVYLGMSEERAKALGLLTFTCTFSIPEEEVPDEEIVFVPPDTEAVLTDTSDFPSDHPNKIHFTPDEIWGEGK